MKDLIPYLLINGWKALMDMVVEVKHSNATKLAFCNQEHFMSETRRFRVWGLDLSMPKDTPTRNRSKSEALPPERPAEPRLIPTPTKLRKDWYCGIIYNLYTAGRQGWIQHMLEFAWAGTIQGLYNQNPPTGQ